MNKKILEVENLAVSLEEKPLLRGISFDLNEGEIVGLVGRSGSGKTVLSRSLTGIAHKSNIAQGSSAWFQSPTHGKVDLLSLSDKELTTIRGAEIGMIFQEPKVALDPVFTCGYQLSEMARIHLGQSASEATETVREALENMGLEERIFTSYPFQISGGEAQRVMIAMATITRPKLLLADEPTTSLDRLNESQIVDHFIRIREESQFAMLLVSHDQSLINRLAHRVLYLNNGSLEEQPSQEGFIFQPSSGQSHNPNELPLLQVKDLGYTVVDDVNGSEKRILDGVTFDLYQGESLGLVGNSGSGKTTLARNLLRLVEWQQGDISFGEENFSDLSRNREKELRREIQIVFQDPLDSLNPRMSVKDVLMEPLKVYGIGQSKGERIELITEILDRVKLGHELLSRYPHQLSGGERQRVCIARVLLLKPRLLILDEPVTALDHAVRGELLKLLFELKEAYQLTYIFISHDLGLIGQITNRVVVMNEGLIVEEGQTDEVLKHPKNDYTKALVEGAVLNSQELEK